MATTYILGNNCFLEVNLSGTWYAILCQSDMSFHLTQEVILKTGPNSGLAREKTLRFSEASASLSGLTPVDNSQGPISAFYMIQPAVRRNSQQIRLRFVDQGGNSTQISGNALIVDATIGAPVGAFAEATFDLEFSGDPTIEAVTPPSEDSIKSDAWNTTAGQNYLDLTIASNVFSYDNTDIFELLEVDREGIQYDIIGNNLTPGNRRVSYQTATHRLLFQNNFEAGETVFIVFK